MLCCNLCMVSKAFFNDFFHVHVSRTQALDSYMKIPKNIRSTLKITKFLLLTRKYVNVKCHQFYHLVVFFSQKSRGDGSCGWCCLGNQHVWLQLLVCWHDRQSCNRLYHYLQRRIISLASSPSPCDSCSSDPQKQKMLIMRNVLLWLCFIGRQGAFIYFFSVSKMCEYYDSIFSFTLLIILATMSFKNSYRLKLRQTAE